MMISMNSWKKRQRMTIPRENDWYRVGSEYFHIETVTKNGIMITHFFIDTGRGMRKYGISSWRQMHALCNWKERKRVRRSYEIAKVLLTWHTRSN